MRRAALVLLGAALAVALAAPAIVARLRREDPLAALPREQPGAAIVERDVHVERWNGRALVHVTLDGAAVGRVRFVVSLPDPLPHAPLPIVVVLGGLRGGSNAIRELSEAAGDPGPNAIAGFDWPLPAREPVLGDLLHLRALRRAALSVPGQLDALLRWACRQPWADPERVSLLGFSLGGFVVPAAQRLVQERGGDVRWSVLAYAGAPIGAVIAGHPSLEPRWLARALGWAADMLLRPVEPSLHLAHLRGRFLYMGGRVDRLVAPAAAERLRELVPEPRSVILVEGNHMGVGAEKQRLLREVIARTRSWLVDEGAIEPPRPASLTSSRPRRPAPR
jgi:hypothetical protein